MDWPSSCPINPVSNMEMNVITYDDQIATVSWFTIFGDKVLRSHRARLELFVQRAVGCIDCCAVVSVQTRSSECHRPQLLAPKSVVKLMALTRI